MKISSQPSTSLCYFWQDSNGNGKLVSWEVWAALSELIATRDNPALLPPVTAAGVWQRAEEIRRAESTQTADPALDHTSREGLPRSHRVGDLGARSAAGSRGIGGGYGDISFWADEDRSREQISPNECRKAVGTGNDRTSQNPPHPTSPGSIPARERPTSAPQTSGAGKGRLHKTLATSRTSWSLRSRSQRQLRRGQGRTRGDNRGLRRSSSSPSHRHGVACSPAAFPDQRRETPYSRRFSGREGAERPFPAPTPRRWPMTAPVEQENTRSDTRDARPVPASQRSCQSAHGNTRTREVGDGRQPDLGTSTAFESHSLGGVWDRGAVADGGDGGSELEWRRDWTARDEMESGHLRTETASAKRKASQYQTCMLEAQVADYEVLSARD